MKAISLRQPWAWALFHGKSVENRNWPSHYTGPLLIHASKKFDHDGYFWIRDMFPELKMPHRDDFPLGAFVGQVRMVDCVSWYPSPWFFGEWGHVYENPEEFDRVIPYKGELGIFNVPDDVVKI
jgi:hypothetical protein